MLSRVADSLYWMGRYLERAENITRLLLVTEDFSTETQGLAEDLAQTAWKDMLTIFPSAQLKRNHPVRPPLGSLPPGLLHRPGESLFDSLLDPEGAGERAFRARGADARGLPGAERSLSGARGLRAEGDARPPRVPRRAQHHP